ncbi:YjjI family glycine radical enzyme [Hydrogenispora ethanolica]|uniref:YjjI family glycine radical enzyme n=1 Tax=Hydrogenispora ethanolica TaxID=1082276 RepID=A0A4R1S8I0_HYDET|nr:YjjI family glycine radical enzyme [Hydrogenispora ethanolica]TCL75210.1 YjjI family glycine radical enzyme [Hydrogenispora ethanolica]
MDAIRNIIGDTTQDYHQKRSSLAAAAENALPYPELSEAAREYLAAKVICDINEGHAPYRPRYILPDYQKFIAHGSAYLNLEAPRDLWEAVNGLLILYRYVPSITGYPVYLGQIDELLEPFAAEAGERELEKLLRLYLVQVDRTLPDAFVHLNIGPADTRTGRMLLKLERELRQAVPNLSLKYLPGTTGPEFTRLAVETAVAIGKPYFVNHAELVSVWGERYGIASCYNTLKIGGGSYTLVRLNLKEVAGRSAGYRDFLERQLPEAVRLQCEIINRRNRFIVEEAKFFESSFLAREGLIERSSFTAMAGVFGMYEAVESLSGGGRMGFDRAADEMAVAIAGRLRELVRSHPGAYCEGTGGRIGFHAQSGIDSDIDVTAGVRIKIGAEPPLFDQLRLAGRLHPFFDTGISDITLFDRTAEGNPAGVQKIIDGAMASGVRIMAVNRADSELVRITGYLVKRADIERYFRGEPLREGTVRLGAESVRNNRVLERAVRGF